MLDIRRASSDDSAAIYAIANSDAVRKVSFATEPFSWETHQRWFNKVVDDPAVLLVVAYQDQDMAGYIRFNRHARQAVIGIALATQYTAQGLGSIVLNKGIELLFSVWPDINQIVAQVKTDNHISQRFFIKNGFVPGTHITVNDHSAQEFYYELSNR
jgi:UDP-2,4-diacetamido-2,4,6-trideoxy-beta-L-altropyranose hydrolase